MATQKNAKKLKSNSAAGAIWHREECSDMVASEVCGGAERVWTGRGAERGRMWGLVKSVLVREGYVLSPSGQAHGEKKGG